MAIVVPIISEWDPKGLNKAGSDIKRAQGGWGKVGAGFRSALLPATAGLAGMAAAGVKLAQGAAEDAAAAQKLAKSLKNVTGATDDQVASVEDWISAQGKALGVADDQLRPALQTLAQASGDIGQAQRDAALAMDIAAASGTDAETAAKAIAKAYDGSYGSLKKLVPGIDDAALASKDFGKIMDSTAGIVGGQAAEAAGTAAGQQQKLAVAMAEAGESVGAALLPVIQKLLDLLLPIAHWMGENTKLVLILAGAFAAIATIIVVVNAAMAVYGTVMALVEANQKRAAAGQWALNAAMLANPAVLITVAIIALVVAVVVLWKKCEGFRKVVTAVFQGFLSLVRKVWSWIKGNWPLLLTILLGPIALAVAAIVKHWDKIKAGAKAVLDWLKTAWTKVTGWLTQPFKDAWAILSGIFDKIKSAIQNVLDLIGRIKLPSLSDLNPFSRSAPTAATVYAAPVSGGYGRSVGGRSSTTTYSPTLNVFGAVDPEGTAREVQRLLDSHASRQGRASNAPRRRAW